MSGAEEARVVAAVASAGAEIFFASSNLTYAMAANPDVADAGYMDFIHPGVSAHAEINARLILHLARGWLPRNFW